MSTLSQKNSGSQVLQLAFKSVPERCSSYLLTVTHSGLVLLVDKGISWQGQEMSVLWLVMYIEKEH
jgi:hypothetical protein